MDTRGGLCATVLGLALGCAAVHPSPAAPSTLERIKSTRVIKLGYRDSAIPFSYVGSDGRPVGYSVELCTRVVDGLRNDLEMPDLRAEWIKVWQAQPGDGNGSNLHFASEPRRQELIRRLNRAPGGTADLVALRSDLLTHMDSRRDLAALDRDPRFGLATTIDV